MFADLRVGGGGGDCAVSSEEFQKLKALCGELRKEKDILRDSLSREQSVNAVLLRRFETEAHAASEIQIKDQKLIGDLQRELKNCSQEIAFLQDQICRINEKVPVVDEHLEALQRSHAETEKLHKKVKLLENELVRSESMRIFFKNKADGSDAKLQNLAAQIEKLEGAVSSVQLESQCEIESMKLEMMSLEQRCFQAEQSLEQSAKEKVHVNFMHRESSLQFDKSRQRVRSLEETNDKLQEDIVSFERSIRVLFTKLDCHLGEWLKRNFTLTFRGEKNDDLPADLEGSLAFWIGKGYEDVLRPLLEKLGMLTSFNGSERYDLHKMPNQIGESESIAQLKEELRNEKLRSKEESEDLTQAMAELRYQIKGMLEEESKRRAMIEHASLHRIQELEAEVQKEKLKASKAIQHFHKARELVKSRDMEIQHLRHSVQGTSENPILPGSTFMEELFDQDSSSSETHGTASQAFIEWHKNGDH